MNTRQIRTLHSSFCRCSSRQHFAHRKGSPLKSQISNFKSQILLSLALLCLMTSLARAEFPQPRLDRVKPLGASAGSEVDIEINGPEMEKAERAGRQHAKGEDPALKQKK